MSGVLWVLCDSTVGADYVTCGILIELEVGNSILALESSLYLLSATPKCPLPKYELFCGRSFTPASYPNPTIITIPQATTTDLQVTVQLRFLQPRLPLLKLCRVTWRSRSYRRVCPLGWSTCLWGCCGSRRSGRSRHATSCRARSTGTCQGWACRSPRRRWSSWRRRTLARHLGLEQGHCR